MSGNLLTTEQLSAPAKSFCIKEKLKTEGSSWSYSYPAGAHNDGVNYQMITRYVEDVEFAIYKKIEKYFFLVDFADNYESLNSEAKEIVDRNPSAKASIISLTNSN